MQKIIIALIACLPLFVTAQTEGIQFQTLSNWEQVKAKAKQENKYIFVDFYATWCGPCKAMDKDIYPSAKIGSLANGRFISIKIQQDKTPSDTMAVRNWYLDADSLTKEFFVSALPSLLFFSPDGRLINKTVGYQDEASFVVLLRNALTTKSGYQTLVEEYRQGNLAFKEMANLAMEAKKIGNTKLADSIAEKYKNEYLYQLSNEDLLTKENLQFITSFPSLITSKERIFNFFYKEPEKADELVRAGYSRDILKSVISREEIENGLFYEGKPITKKPDWGKIREAIKAKFGEEYAELLVSPSSQIAFYKRIGDWKSYSKLIKDAIKKYPPAVNGYKFANKTMIGNFFQRDDWNLNSGAWDIFLHCNEKSILTEALKWSDLSIAIVGSDNGISPIDQYYDTKANLLYKIGKIPEALNVEEKAYEIAKSNAEKQGQKGGGKEYVETIKKIKQGTPTWMDQ